MSCPTGRLAGSDSYQEGNVSGVRTDGSRPTSTPQKNPAVHYRMIFWIYTDGIIYHYVRVYSVFVNFYPYLHVWFVMFLLNVSSTCSHNNMARRSVSNVHNHTMIDMKLIQFSTVRMLSPVFGWVTYLCLFEDLYRHPIALRYRCTFGWICYESRLFQRCGLHWICSFAVWIVRCR